MPHLFQAGHYVWSDSLFEGDSSPGLFHVDAKTRQIEHSLRIEPMIQEGGEHLDMSLGLHETTHDAVGGE